MCLQPTVVLIIHGVLIAWMVCPSELVMNMMVKKWQAYKLVSCIVKINVSVYGAEEEWEVQVKSRNKTHFLLHHACSCSWVTWTYYFYSYNKVLNHRVHLASCLSFCVSRLVQKLGSEPLSLLKPTLVWWCITIGMLFSRSQSHWGNWYD